MHAQLCCKGDTADQKEERVERIRDHHEQGVDGESLIERSQDEVYEREDGENCDKHDIIYDRWVVVVPFVYHISNQTKDEESP